MTFIEYEAKVRKGLVVDEPLLYCLQVSDKSIRACKKIKLACRRHIRDMQAWLAGEGKYDWDLAAAYKPIKFSRLLKHWEGEWAGQFFEPALWQKFILGAVFGWKRKDTGRRRFRYAYIEIPRKNGKSFFASVIALYMMCADGEQGAQVYSVATKRDQAKIVWDDGCNIAKTSGLAKYTSAHWLSLKMKTTNSRFEPLASDSKKMDGFNPHCAVADELHAWEDRALWDVIEDGFGARSQPLFFAITTAGYNRNAICFQQRTHGTSILESADGTYSDDTYFVFIADVDDENQKKWDNEDVWWEANPNLGVSKSLEYMHDQCNKAKLMPEKENTFKNKQLDIWTEQQTRWINMEKWDECNQAIERAKLRRAPCYVGIDLSSTTDLTACVLVFPPGPKNPYEEYAVLPFFYIPEDNMKVRSKRDKVPYAQWVAEGYVKTTPGDIIDLDFIRKDIIKLGEEFQILEIGFDPWKAIEIATQLEQESFEMIQMRQGHATLGAPTAALEKFILAHELRHAGHPVLRWMAANTAVIRDSNDNIKPDKEKSYQRIDGIVATIMAIGRAIQGVGTKASVYEKRGMLIFGSEKKK